MTPTPGSLEALVEELTAARAAAAALARADVTGVRAVESRPGRRHYMCAFADGRIGCVDAAARPVIDRATVMEVLRTAILVEQADDVVDIAALQVVRGAAERVGSASDEQAIEYSTSQLADAVSALVAWIEDPSRALATMGQLDDLVTLHDRARHAHIGFIAATDPLVPIQDTLPAEFVTALRDLEQACSSAGLTSGLTAQLAGALEAIDSGVDELLERYWLPPPDGRP